MRRLIIVSNRLPINITKRGAQYLFQKSVGGVATGLSSLYRQYNSIWVGWPGINIDKKDSVKKIKIKKELKKEKCYPVFLDNVDIENYYEGFCNKTIWSLFHYFTQYTVYNKTFWEYYKKVNEKFAKEVLKIYKKGDIIWVHDYQLMLLPELIREKYKDAEIGFFLHIPFPSYEIFSTLPYRREILQGILGADLIGFHIYDYADNFLDSVSKILGYERSMNQLIVEDRIVKVDAFPMGIDYEKFSNAQNKKEVQEEIKKIKKGIGNKKIILSIDRLDYTKGIPQRVEAFDEFLTKYPEYKEKIVLILVAVPSRTKVHHYNLLKKVLDELLGKINGKHGTIGWVPILYFYRFFSFNSLAALYSISDIALITPLRDGMNLIAKEYIATRTDKTGVLILSEMTGSAKELGEALIVNPNNKEEIVDAIKKAIEMDIEEQKEINDVMQKRLYNYNIEKWGNDFIEKLHQIKSLQFELKMKKFDKKIERSLIKKYRKAKKRLIILDYGGTLKEFTKDLKNAGPDNEILKILKKLQKDIKNEIILISGRKKDTIEEWFGKLNINLIAEHGIWIKEKEKEWKVIGPLNSEWKDEIRKILESFVYRTPGSFIEEKDFSFVWDYRKVDTELGEIRARELKGAIMHMTANLHLGVVSGERVVEIKDMGVDKGKAVMKWLENKKWDFILAIGDDWTDEDLFNVLPDTAYSIKVGYGFSKALYNVESVLEVRKLLKKLTR